MATQRAPDDLLTHAKAADLTFVDHSAEALETAGRVLVADATIRCLDGHGPA